MPKWKLKIGSLDAFEFNVARKEDKLNGTVKLVSLKLQKEFYVPGHIEAILQIVPKDGGNVNDIDIDSLVGQFVSLNDESRDVAKDYIVFECQPEYKPEKKQENKQENNQTPNNKEQKNQASLYVTLDIYSPEHCLTFKKYNKCYVAKKLGADIFKTIAEENSDKIKGFNYDHIQRISLKNANGDNMEFIQPYLIQYEETALDFLSRVANECGLFLYYENGQWILCSQIPVQGQKMGDYDSLTFKKITSQEKDMEDENIVIGPKEEYLDTLTENKNEYTDEDLYKRMGFTAIDGWIFNFSNWLKKANLAEILGTITVDLAKNGIKGKYKLNDENEKWNENHIKPYENDKDQCTTVDGKKVVCQLSNYNAKDYFKSDFYKKIRKEEIAATKKKMHINYGTNYTSFWLNEIIIYENSKYLVCKISYSYDCMNDLGTEYTHLEVDAIPLKNDDRYPPLLEKKPANKIESQVGIVTANNDPGNMGRLQFRYSWQPTEGEKPSSPWVSIAQPFASEDAGFRFMPQVGDEIIIGYENGRMDRPFMIGGVATKSRKLDVSMNKLATIENATPNSYLDDSKSGYFNNDFILKSPSGQYIKFLVPSTANFMNAVTTFAPILKTMHSYVPASSDSLSYASTAGQKFSGGINIGDAYGFFNINLSTEKRKVLISSPVGDVQIDAFTGITISAPNGDVKIEGKNVEIVAGNNLTLKSGSNIDKMKKFYSTKAPYAIAAGFTNAVVSEVKSLAKFVDLKLVRTICDALIKPVGGTLLIKSKRYLRLEAGKGTTTLPKVAFEKDSGNQNNLLKAKAKEMKVRDVIDATIKLINWYERNYSDYIKNLRERKKTYKDKRDLCITAINNFINNRGTINYDNNPLTEAKIENFDTVEDIQQAIEENPDIDIQTTIPKFNKFSIQELPRDNKNQKLADSYEDVMTTKNNLKIAARSLGMQVKNIDLRVKDINKNLTGEIQNHIITINDSTLVTGQEMSYKNEIFRLLSKDIEGNNAVLGGEMDDPTQPIIDIEPTGVRLKIYNNFVNAIENFDFNNNNTFAFDHVTKRKIIWSLLQVLKKKCLVTIDNESGLSDALFSGESGKIIALNNDNVCESDQKWKDYLSCVKPYQGGIGTKVLNLFNQLDWFGAKDIADMFKSWGSETFLYNPETQGEILLSDIDGNTCKIEKEGITVTPNSDIKKAMKDLENI